MLRDLVQILVELKLTEDAPADFEMNVRFSHHLSCLFRSTSNENYFVKLGPASGNSRLRSEYQSLCKVHASVAKNVPRALGFVTRADWHVLVLSDKPASTPAKLSSITRDAACLAAWVEFLGRLAANGTSAEPAEIDLSPQLGFFEQHLPALHDYATSKDIQEVRTRYSWVSQHGDLADNNVQQSGPTPIIYDWEDHGVLGLPGLDLAVLVGSLLEFQPRALLSLLDEQHADHPALRRLIEACGVTVEDFKALVPIYFGCFLWLKHTHGYIRQIQQQVHELVDALLLEV